MNRCDICKEIGIMNCKNCYLGNPCKGCEDYDEHADICISNGGCQGQDSNLPSDDVKPHMKGV